jgi:hypothetical protein
LGMPDHQWFYTLSAVERTLDRCGLQIEHLKRFGLAPGILLSRLGRTTGLGGGATARRDGPKPRRSVAESARRQKLRVALRYGLGQFAAGIGPETAFVIAGPKAG